MLDSFGRMEKTTSSRATLTGDSVKGDNTMLIDMLMMQWMLMLVSCMIPPSGISRSTNKDQGTFRGGGMGVKIHRHAYLINV